MFEDSDEVRSRLKNRQQLFGDLYVAILSGAVGHIANLSDDELPSAMARLTRRAILLAQSALQRLEEQGYIFADEDDIGD